MSIRNRTATSLGPTAEGSTGGNDSPDIPNALEQEDESIAIRIYDRGVTEIERSLDVNGDGVAFELGMSFQKLSDYRRGKRVIALHRLVRMCRKNQDAALAVLSQLSKLAGLAPPRRIQRVTKRDVQRQLSLELRKLAPVYELLRKEAAAKLGTDEQTIDDCWEESTDIRSVGIE